MFIKLKKNKLNQNCQKNQIKKFNLFIMFINKFANNIHHLVEDNTPFHSVPFYNNIRHD